MSWNIFRKKHDVVVPSLDWWQKDVPAYTPDILQLSVRPYHRFFICDETMLGHHKHGLLGQDKIETDIMPWTKTKFSLLKKNLSSLTTVLPLRLRLAVVPYARIKGELYGIKTSQIIELDKYKLNGVEFQRYRVSLLIPYRRAAQDYWAKDKAMYEKALEQTPFWDEPLEAWMYVGKTDYWEDRLTRGHDSDGDWGRSIRYRRDQDGAFRATLRNNFYQPVDTYTPNNELLEKYYYYRDLRNS